MQCLALLCIISVQGCITLASDAEPECTDDAQCAADEICDGIFEKCAEAECESDEQCRAQYASQRDCFDDSYCLEGQRCADAKHTPGGDEAGECVIVATSSAECAGDDVLTQATPTRGGNFFEFCGNLDVTCEFPRCAFP
jgi:hypothetical protein